MPLVINSLGVGTHTHTDVRTETIVRNQVGATLWPISTWIKKYYNAEDSGITLSACFITLMNSKT